MEENEKVEMTKKFVDNYLKNKGLKTVRERNIEKSLRNILGVMNNDYAIELQKIVFEYANSNNIDLFPDQERKSPVIGVLSQNEQELADYLVTQYSLNNANKEQDSSHSM